MNGNKDGQYRAYAMPDGSNVVIDRTAPLPDAVQADVNNKGEALAQQLEADLLALEDAGYERLSDTRRATLRARYAGFDHPVAAEVVRWLDGRDLMTDAEVQTQ